MVFDQVARRGEVLKINYFLSLCFMILFSFESSAKPKILIVGTSTGYPPYYYLDNGKVQGFLPDLLREVVKFTSFDSVKFQSYPWKRMLKNGGSGKVDAIFPLFKTKEREAFLNFPKKALVQEINVLFSKNDFIIPWDGDFTLLKNYELGVVTDYSYGSEFDKIIGIKKNYSKRETMLVEKLIANRFQVGVGSKEVIQYHLKKNNIKNIRFYSPPVVINQLFIGFSKNSKKINAAKVSQEFDTAMDKIEKNGILDKIKKKYHLSFSNSQKK